MWAAASGAVRTHLEWERTQRSVPAVAFAGNDRVFAANADGQRLAVRHADRLIRLWDVARRVPVLALDSAGYSAQQLTFSQDGQFLIGGTTDDPVWVVWKITDE